MSNFGKLLNQRKVFIAQVYAILAIQLAITFTIAKYLRNHQPIYKFAIKFFIPLALLSFIIIFMFPFVPSYFKFGLFCIFSFIFGILSIGATKLVSNEIIEVALLSTIGVFIGMTVIGLGLASIGIDLNFMTYILLSALIGLIIVRFVLLFVDVNHKVNKYLATFSIILFSIFVAYDTNRMLQKNYSFDQLDTAMSFYLDIENLFTNFVEMNLNQNGGK